MRKLDFVHGLIVLYQRWPVLWDVVEPGATFCVVRDAALGTVKAGDVLPGITSGGIIKAVRLMVQKAGVVLQESDTRDTGGHLFRSIGSSAIYHARRLSLAVYNENEHVQRTRHAEARQKDGSNTFDRCYQRPLPPRQLASLERRAARPGGILVLADEVPFC